ncbi:hypothetical protein POM88_052704 [Heracleum sosnowskyi]|uniref:F-box domain-containing protein n=1 Tax=Heracleum sosnowskyi TaxID=360622 RepID=A0AAD8GQQ2_9APIA|nr:hypothetical protein POM88_052704 [Heracleum sosnowskyi]
MAARTNPTLFDDLIIEILVRVPVKSLVRFQSVSQTWLSLIKDPAFVKSQLLHAITTETDQTRIMRRGINCFSLLHVDPRKIYTYFWNPAIRQSKVIPSCNTWSDIDEEALGFGYDGVAHDYKVFRVVKFESRPSFRAEVYSDNQNAWRNVPDPIDIPYGHFDVCVNGFLCGIGEHGIMAFDLNREVLNCAVKVPTIDGVHNHAHIDSDDDTRVHDNFQILEFHNSVAVTLLMNVDDTNRRICIWTLNDYACLHGGGVEASWTPMFSITLATSGELIRGYFSNGDFQQIIRNKDDLWIYCNADKKEAKINAPLPTNTSGHHYYSYNVYKYMESLVSLKGFRQVNKSAGSDDN